MLNRIVKNYIINAIISGMKGKKRWLVIIVLVIAQILQSSGLDLTDLTEALTALLETSEG